MDFISRCKRVGATVIIPDNVYFIPQRAFSMDDTIEKVIVGKNVSFIDEMAFSFCVNLREVYFDPCSICETIKHGAFMFCKSLKKINLPYSLRRIDRMAFFFNKDLKEIIIPPSIQILDSYIFALSGMEHIIFLNDNIHYIDKYAFSGVENIKKITICGMLFNAALCEGLVVEKIGKEKNIQNILIQKARDIKGRLNQKIDDIWWICCDINREKFTYGRDMRTTYNELRKKLNNNISELAISENWTMDTEINMEQYSLMSDNCWYHIKIFMNEFGYNDDDKLTIRKIMELSQTQRNFFVFEDFVNKYVIKDDGTRNSIKIKI